VLYERFDLNQDFRRYAIEAWGRDPRAYSKVEFLLNGRC
jgi:hypothetical protein